MSDLELSNEAQESEYQGWQVPRFPIRQSPLIPVGSSSFSDDNSQFSAWFNLKEPIKKEEQEMDNNIIVPPLGTADAIIKNMVTSNPDVEQVQLDENNKNGPGSANDLDQEEQEEYNESIVYSQRLVLPRSDRWSDYDEDNNDIGGIPTFGTQPGGKAPQSSVLRMPSLDCNQDKEPGKWSWQRYQ